MAKIPTDFYCTLPIDTPIIIRKLPNSIHGYIYDSLTDKLAEIEETTDNKKEVWHKAYLLLKTP